MAQLSELREVLQRERDRLVARAGVALAGEGAEPMDVQDQASDEAGRRLMLSLSDIDRARLREVEAALARLDQGTYGICEETGEPIPFGRLQAEPTSRYTVEALELLEDERARERIRNHGDEDELY